MPKRDLDTETGVIDSDSLCTPPDIRDRLYDLWGGPPGCDPCSNPHSIIGARRELYEGGLLLPWVDERGKAADNYVNWPYSVNEPWADKAIYELKIGHAREMVVLCMTSTSTEWWSKMMTRPRINPRVICTKRIPFLGPSGKPLPASSRFDPSLIYYTRSKRRIAKFDRLFSYIARWTTWGR